MAGKFQESSAMDIKFKLKRQFASKNLTPVNQHIKIIKKVMKSPLPIPYFHLLYG